MRVLQITPTFFPSVGGIETVVDEISSQLLAQGIHTEVAHVSPQNAALKEERKDRKRIWRVPLIGGRLVGVAPHIKSLSENFDLLHVHDPQLMAITANTILFGRTKPAVLSTHGGFHHTKNSSFMKRMHERLLMRTALNSYRGVLASSSADYQYFREYSNRVSICQNGINTNRFNFDKTVFDTSRWIYWGRLSRNKRLDRVIECVDQARQLGFKVDLCICGPDFDNLTSELEKKIEIKGLGDLIQLKPFLSFELLSAELSTRSVFITASEHEGFGLSIIEALAAGCFILCRNISPINDFIEPDLTGQFLQFDGGSDDARKISQLLGVSTAGATANAEACRSSAREHDWSRAITHFITSYEKALARP